jgi:hypothetical protein
MAYLGNSPGVASQRVETALTATASQTVFTPSSGYTLGYCDVYQNGVKLVNGDDYTAANGTTITLATGAASGDSIVIVASFPRGLSDGYLKSEADAKYLTIANPTASGNLTFTGTGNRITGDFSNATVANRVLFQTSTANSNTVLGAIPNGTATAGVLQLYANSDPTNTSIFQATASAGAGLVTLISGTSGAGTYLPMALFTGGSERVRLTTGGNIGVNTTQPQAKFETCLAASAYSTVMNANAVNDVVVLRAPFGYTEGTAGSTSNGGARWGLRLVGRNDGSYDNNKSAGIYAVSEETGAAYNRAVGLAFHTSSFDASHIERMRIDSSGRVTMPYQPAFKACLGATQSYTFSGSRAVALSYSPTEWNRGGHYNTGTGLFTAPVTGMYCFQFGMVALSPSAETFLVIEPLFNGTGNALKMSASSYAKNNEAGINASSVIYMAAGDTIKFNVYTPATITIGNSDAGHTWPEGRTFMSGFLLG